MKTLNTQKGEITVLNDKNIVFNTTNELLDLFFSIPSDTLVISTENLTDSFIDLKTGIAGEFLQKVSTYQKRLIILGEFSQYKSKSLQDFIYESNKYGKIVFATNLTQALDYLS